MIRIGDVIIRNIQEQVAKNKADIAALRNVESILNQFGITVLGRVDEDTDIPETKPGGGDYTYGDAWLVGTTTPYDMYIWTRTDDPDVGEFVNIGPISMVGPQGPQGEQGPSGTIAIGTVSTGLPGTSASVENVGTSENAVFNFIIPQGAKGETGSQGERGLTGETGPQGQTGPQGPQGDPGQSFMIVGVITNTSQLPDPTTTQRNYAYVYNDGDPSTSDRLYYIIGTEGDESWTYSLLAAAGTTVYVNGNPVSTWDADTKIDEPSTAGSVGDVLTLGSSGPEWATPSSGGGVIVETKTFSNISGLYSFIDTNLDKIIGFKLRTSSPQTIYTTVIKIESNEFTISSSNSNIYFDTGIDYYFTPSTSRNFVHNSGLGYSLRLSMSSSFLALAVAGTSIVSNAVQMIISTPSIQLTSIVNQLTFKFYLTEAST